MSLVALLTSVLALLVALSALARAGRVKKVPVPLQPRGPNLTCGCEHELAMHDPQTGKCHDEMWVPFYDKALGKDMRRRETCKCRQYTGDRPVDTFFSPRIVT